MMANRIVSDGAATVEATTSALSVATMIAPNVTPILILNSPRPRLLQPTRSPAIGRKFGRLLAAIRYWAALIDAARGARHEKKKESAAPISHSAWAETGSVKAL
jgi:hypothetical protein